MRSRLGCLVLLAMIGCSSAPKETQVSTPPSTAVATTTTPAASKSLLVQTGVPEYPGATQSGSAVSPESGGLTHFYAIFSTPDSADKVVAFYKDQLKFPSSSRGGVTQLVGRTKEGADAQLFVTPQQGETQISIKAIIYSKKS